MTLICVFQPRHPCSSVVISLVLISHVHVSHLFLYMCYHKRVIAMKGYYIILNSVGYSYQTRTHVSQFWHCWYPFRKSPVPRHSAGDICWRRRFVRRFVHRLIVCTYMCVYTWIISLVYVPHMSFAMWWPIGQ